MASVTFLKVYRNVPTGFILEGHEIKKEGYPYTLRGLNSPITLILIKGMRVTLPNGH